MAKQGVKCSLATKTVGRIRKFGTPERKQRHRDLKKRRRDTIKKELVEEIVRQEQSALQQHQSERFSLTDDAEVKSSSDADRQ